MSASRRRSAYTNDVYTDGNTVRKLNRTEPQIRPERVVQAEYERSRMVRRNQEKALHMDGAYVFALTIAAVITLLLCSNYLYMQSSITTRINNIETLELQLENLRSGNDALQTRLDTYVDLDHVYQVATEELNMVYANKDQILLYDKSESEYVRQYEDIPKHE
ncbi:MAG: cell division protein FtsL [Clostridium sp.]